MRKRRKPLNFLTNRLNLTEVAMKKPRHRRGFFISCSQNQAGNIVYRARTCLLRRDLCLAAVFFGMMPFDTEWSMAGTAAL